MKKKWEKKKKSMVRVRLSKLWLLLILKKQCKKECVALIVLLTIVCNLDTEQVEHSTEHCKPASLLQIKKKLL